MWQPWQVLFKQPNLPNGKGQVCQPNSPLIELRQVSKTFATGAGEFVALNGIDLSIQAGEFVAIVGKSGSGKSTLINMITGIDRPTAGEIWVAGTPVHTLSEEQIALWRGRTIGVIFQFFQLLPTLTAVENVMLPMDYGERFANRERPERALQLLDLVGMKAQAHQLPAALSGGQLQSVAIARALANDPPILVADEPTGNLDSKSTALILQLFEQLVAQGKTILIVTHDRELAARTHRTIVLADGQIIMRNAEGGMRSQTQPPSLNPPQIREGIVNGQEKLLLLSDRLPSRRVPPRVWGRLGGGSCTEL